MNDLEKIYYSLGKLEFLSAKIHVTSSDLLFLENLFENNKYLAASTQLHENTPKKQKISPRSNHSFYIQDNYSQYGGERDGYGGYLDDDFINDALGGEPEAYWNID